MKQRLGPTTLAVLLLLQLSVFARSETLVTQCKVVQVNERGFVLAVGTEPLAVEDTPETKFWFRKAIAKRGAFKEGDVVHARIKTTADPPMLRELSDGDTWRWLEANRKEPRQGTIESIDAKYLTLKLSDGSTFRYRATDKTEVKLNGKSASGLADLTVGMPVYVKGRTLANLDTWLHLVSDQPIATAKARTKTPKSRSKPIAAIPASGKLEGKVLGNYTNLKMFDIFYEVRTLHISYNAETKFVLDGKAASSRDLQKDLNCRIVYRRDRQGRILASRVELWR